MTKSFVRYFVALLSFVALDVFGADLSKIANNGSVLPASAALGAGASEWACTRDNVTGLTWEVKTTSGYRNMLNLYIWNDGFSYASAVNAASLCGSNVWRVPTIKELSGIVDFSRNYPAINTEFFPNTRPSIYWTSTLDPSTVSTAWYVEFVEGEMAPFALLDDGYSVRLVSGAIEQASQLQVDGNGLTVSDKKTGLMWKREQERKNPNRSPETDDWILRTDTFTWQDALQRAVNDRTGGYSDWRLPTIMELRSIIDETKHNPAFDRSSFLDYVLFSTYWSSSPTADFLQYGNKSWGLTFEIGVNKGTPRTYLEYVRLVRSGAGAIQPPIGPSKALSFVPSRLDFVIQEPKTSETKKFTLTNTGTDAVAITGVDVGGADYTRTHTCSSTLGVGASCSISVTCTPSVTGMRAGAITVISNAVGSPYIAALSCFVAGTYVPKQFALTVAKNGSGVGSVSASMAGINCGTSCSATFAEGTSITLTASPADAGYAFAGWTGGGCSGTGSCNVVMDQAKSVNAGFTIVSGGYYPLTINIIGAGSVTGSPGSINCWGTCVYSIRSGSVVTLRASASIFEWSNDGCFGFGVCGVLMNSPKTVVADFARIK